MGDAEPISGVKAVNLRDLLRGMRRRWYLVVAGLLITATLCVGALQVVPASYTARASVLLLPPNSTVGTGGNPYLSLAGLQGAVDVLSRAMMSEQVVGELTGESSTDSYTLEADATTSGPILVLDVKSRSADGALGLMRSVLNRAPTVLHDLQTDVAAPDESLISLSVIAEDSTATKDQKSQIRTLIVVLAGGLALTVLGTIAVDSMLRRRSTRQRTDSSDDHSDPAGVVAPPRNASDSAVNALPRPRTGLRAPAKSMPGRQK